ncbi:LORF2 protein, partial [Crocuta crocuta]
NRYLCKEDIQMAHKHMKRCTTLVIIWKMQIRTTMRYYIATISMPTIRNKNTENRVPGWLIHGEIGTLVHCWWDCKMMQLLWKTVWKFLKKLKIEVSYEADPAIALLGIYPRDTEMLMHRSTCTPMFIAALSTIAKTWKEPKCPSTDEWIKKMWFIYTMEYYMAMRKNEIWPCVATWMDLEGVMLSEISQAEKDKYHMFARIGGL